MKLLPLVLTIVGAAGCRDASPTEPATTPNPRAGIPPPPAPAAQPPAATTTPPTTPTRVASGLRRAIAWVEDAEYLYWLQHDGQDAFGDERYPGSIWRVALAGGPPELLVRDLENPAGLGADDRFLYVATGAAPHRQLLRLPRGGAKPEPVFALEGVPMFVAAHVYWQAHAEGDGPARTIYRRPIDGSGADEVVLDTRRRRGRYIAAWNASPQIVCALVAGRRDTNLECLTPGADPPRIVARERTRHGAGAVVVDGRDVYWRSMEHYHRVRKASVDGGAAPVVALEDPDPDAPIELVTVRDGRLFVEHGLLALDAIAPGRATRRLIPEESRMSFETDYLPVFVGESRLAWVGFGIRADGERVPDEIGIWTVGIPR